MIKGHLLQWLTRCGYRVRDIRGCRHIVVDNGWRLDLLSHDLRDRSAKVYPYGRDDPFADRVPSKMSFQQLMDSIREGKGHDSSS